MQERSDRLEQDLDALQALASHSAILTVESSGNPPDRCRLLFAGQGVARVSALKAKVEWTDEHRIELRMPFLYPAQPPDIRWETALFHPNLSYSGFLSLDDVGLPWGEDVGLEVVAERLWDVARLAYVNLPCAVNPAAKRWIEESEDSDAVQFPVDPRPLRKIELPGARSNVVRYQRRGRETVLDEVPPKDDLLIIDEDSAPPFPAVGAEHQPDHVAPPRPRTQEVGKRRDDGEDLFYIGE